MSPIPRAADECGGGAGDVEGAGVHNNYDRQNGVINLHGAHSCGSMTQACLMFVQLACLRSATESTMLLRLGTDRCSIRSACCAEGSMMEVASRTTHTIHSK